MSKTIWLISQSASTPETGMGGRHYYLARGLEGLGYKVYIIAASYTHLLREPPKVSENYTLERREGVNIIWIKTPYYSRSHSKKRIWSWFYFSWKLLRVPGIVDNTPSVILYSSPSLIGYLGAEWLARRLHARLAFEVRDIWPLTLCEIGGYSSRHPFIQFLQWVENRAYARSDVVLSNLKNSHLHMTQHGLDPDKFYWVPNGVSLEEARTPDPLPDGVLNLVPEGGFYVGYVGTVGVANNLALLLQAAEHLQEYPDIKLVIVGKGQEKDVLQRTADAKGLTNVLFIDAIPKRQVQTMLGRFDALFMTLTKDDLFAYGVSPNKLFDYLFAGKPIIYGVASGAYHPVADAGAGLEIPPEDVGAVIDAILKLYRMSEVDRREMGENGRRAVLAQYDYDKLAVSLANVLFPG